MIGPTRAAMPDVQGTGGTRNREQDHAMTQQEIIDKARSVVDEIEGNSYVIAPTPEHAEKVNSAAPAPWGGPAALGRQGGRPGVRAEGRRRQPGAASFMAAANYANASILVAGVCSTLLVVLGAFFPTLPSVSGTAADSARVAATAGIAHHGFTRHPPRRRAPGSPGWSSARWPSSWWSRGISGSAG